MKIKPLPPEVQSVLRTGIAMTDITQCAIELVQNSLDAKATSIAVRVDLENFTIQVVDNGRGLAREELDLVGTRYMTNKCHSLKDFKTNLKYYGFRGESLASLRECCGILMLISRVKDSSQTYTKVFRAGKESHSAKMAANPRLCTGTTVVVRDFLHNFPVRRARIQPAIDIESVRLALMALSLIHHRVLFILRNDITKAVILQTKEYQDCGDALKHHCNMREDVALIPVSVSKPPFKIFANISRATERSDQFQFVYVNGRLVRNKDIYKLLKKNLSKSFYLRNIGKEIKPTNDMPKETFHPIFLIQIQCPYAEYEISSDPKKQQVEFQKWKIVMRCLEDLVEKFVSTEFNLNNVVESEPDKDPGSIEQLVVQANEHPIQSNVIYGVSVNRKYNDLTLPTNTIISVNISKHSSAISDGLENNVIDNKTVCDAILSSAQVVLANQKTDQSYGLKSPKSNNRFSRSITDCVFSSDVENPFPFKIPNKVLIKQKRKYLSEHITTESETDYTPVKQKATWDSTVSLKQGKQNNSILPIVSYEYFKNAVENINITRDNVFDYLDRNLYKTPKQAVQIDLYRSIKKDSKNNCLRIIQDKTIKYLNQGKSYMDCSKTIFQQEKLPNISKGRNISRESICFTKQNSPHHFFRKPNTCLIKSVSNENQNKAVKLKFLERKSQRFSNFGTTTERYNLRQNWKIFSPTSKCKIPTKSLNPLNLTTKVQKVVECKTKRKPQQGNLIRTCFTTSKAESYNLNRTSNQALHCNHTHKLKNYQLDNGSKEGIYSTKYDTNIIENKVVGKHKLSIVGYKKEVPKSRSMNNNPANNAFFPEALELTNKGSQQFLVDTKISPLNLFVTKKNVKPKSEFFMFSNKKPPNFKWNHKKRPGHCYFIPEYTNGRIPSKQTTLYTNRHDFSLLNNQIFSWSATQGYKKQLSSNSHEKLNFVAITTPPEVFKDQHLLENNNSCKSIVSPSNYEVFCERKCQPINMVKKQYLDESLKEKAVVIDLADFKKNHLSDDFNSPQSVFRKYPYKINNTPDVEIKLQSFIALSQKSNLTENVQIVHNKDLLPQKEEITSKLQNSKTNDIDIPNNSNYIGEFRPGQENNLGLDTKASFPEHKDNKNFTDSISPCKESYHYFQINEKNSAPTELNNWNKETIPGGKTVYINPMTGMSSYTTPNKENEHEYALHKRHWFMPKGTSPILSFNEIGDVNLIDLTKSEKNVIENIVMANCTTDLNTIKWRCSTDTTQDLSEVINLLSESGSCKQAISRAFLKKPCVFSAESLSTAKVLGQVDKKFIAALVEVTGELNKFLVLFDQHAVDERIRLEALIARYKNSDGELVSQPLHPSLELHLTENERALTAALTQKLSKIGLNLVVEGTRVVATSVPLCICNHFTKERNKTVMENTLSVLIRQVLLSAEEVRGVLPSMPHLLSNSINSEACRGAIKFGDPLTLEMSKLLVKKLASCEVPFQCAHGRPVLTPLLELTELCPNDEAIDLRRLSERVSRIT